MGDKRNSHKQKPSCGRTRSCKTSNIQASGCAGTSSNLDTENQAPDTSCKPASESTVSAAPGPRPCPQPHPVKSMKQRSQTALTLGQPKQTIRDTGTLNSPDVDAAHALTVRGHPQAHPQSPYALSSSSPSPIHFPSLPLILISTPFLYTYCKGTPGYTPMTPPGTPLFVLISYLLPNAYI